jgi:hypothetical protein
MLGLGVSPFQHTGQQCRPTRRSRMPHSHNDRLPPLVEMGATDQRIDRLVLYRFLGREILLEGAMHKVDPANDRLPDHATTL